MTRGVLVLDAGGILQLARGDAAAWARLTLAQAQGLLVIVPTPVVAQVHRGGRRGRAVDRLLDAVGVAVPTSDTIARTAGELMGVAGTSDAVDAIVVAEALAGQPSAILTSGSADLRLLLADQGDRSRVTLLGV